MTIDPKIAQTIVSNIKDVLHHEINFFDTQGTIIASTDPSRVGNIHGGAVLAIAQKRTVTVDGTHRYPGARDGINVPVLFNGEVVAVVGVTGNAEEVEDFGNILKKMTEILIRENLNQISNFDRRLMVADVVLLLSNEHKDSGLLNVLASTLRVDLSTPRRAIIGRTLTGTRVDERTYEAIEERKGEFGDCLFSTTPQECCIFSDCKDIHHLRSTLCDDAFTTQGQGLFFGIGEIMDDFSAYWKSYDQASSAVDWGTFMAQHEKTRPTSQCPTIPAPGNTSSRSLFPREAIDADPGCEDNLPQTERLPSNSTVYGDLDFGIIAQSVPGKQAIEFVNRIFNGLNESEIGDLERTFAAYKAYNGSITRAARSMYVHKNTLQNHLNRITEKTGYNPRVLKDYSILDTAFLLHDYLHWHE
ncbi:CdaR family transcriptional regulator [Bifidobacterium bombi]|uniref:Transcriptional regulator, sugar diacid recognition family protein n=1 Tax=Bifidobacterium bombi DSM 19703 TaxID=1341695 RepID=A0A080N3D4_9BIFI|nr:sugar diacid recognition domain-containing protein [Bifidobacterium bombi]KFF31476.1 transcriptional regulator, sugar diacid recognition family protein [Bifidobacterium bombi DSM 19703]